MYTLQQYQGIAFSGQVTVPTTANGVTLTSLLATAGATIPVRIQGVELTNNDASNSIYVAMESGASASKFRKWLTPTEPHWETLCDGAELSKMYVVAVGGASQMYVTVHR